MKFPSVDVFVISFNPIQRRLKEEIKRVGLPEGTLIPGVKAATDARWVNSPTVGHIGVGSAGCTLAHRDAWNRWLNSEHPAQCALILEDDACLTTYGSRWMATCQRGFVNSEIELLQLGVHRTPGIMGARRLRRPTNFINAVQDTMERSVLVTRRRLMYSHACGWGTHAYLISAKCAEMLLAREPDFLMPIDSHFRALSLVPGRQFMRTRQDLWSTTNRASLIDQVGR